VRVEAKGVSFLNRCYRKGGRLVQIHKHYYNGVA
jgi:hypothetical protein